MNESESQVLILFSRLGEQVFAEESNPHRKSWLTFWPHLCDTFYMLLTGQENSVEELRISSPYVRSRFNADLPTASIKEKAYARVHSLYDQLGLDGVVSGAWKDVPILEASLRRVSETNAEITAETMEYRDT